jgi:hypothetical protein
MGALIMLGSLFGLVILIVGLVLRYDPEARGPSQNSGDADD